jgi:hypothetical protein
MAQRFVASGGEKGRLDEILNQLDMVELKKLVLWELERSYTFDDTGKSNQTFQLLQKAESENWLAELVVKLDEKHHSRMPLDLADLVNRAKEVTHAAVVASAAEQPSDAASKTTLDTAAAVPVNAVGSGVPPGSDVLLTAGLLTMEAEYYSTRWWNKTDLAVFVDRWQDLLPRAHAAVTGWRRTRWKPSPSADVRQLSILDAIEVATQAFDEAEAAFLALLDVEHQSDVSSQVFVSRRALRCLIVAVEDIEDLRTGTLHDELEAGTYEGIPLSIPTAALVSAATSTGPIPIVPTALQDAAPFVDAVAYYISRTVRSSEDSLAAISRLVVAVGACAESVQHHMTLGTGPDDAPRWRSAARQLSEDTGSVLTELNIYNRVRRRQEQQDLIHQGSPEQLGTQLRELVESRDRLDQRFHQLSRHLSILCSGFTSESTGLLTSEATEFLDSDPRDRDETQTES